MQKILKISCLIILIVLALSSCAIFKDTNKSSSFTSSTVNVQMQGETIFENDDYKVNYVKFFDPETDPNVLHLVLDVKNKSNKEVRVRVTDGYAVDTDLFIGDENVEAISPNQIDTCTYYLALDNSGIESIEQIDYLDFKLYFYDEKTEERFLETEKIKINIK